MRRIKGLVINRGLIGSFHGINSKFRLLDSEESYDENLKTQPLDWEYRTTKLNYQYNEYGHRSMAPSELPDDYILFTGCSITEGVGMAQEYMYSDIVAKHLNKPYYNLAVGGSGIDLLVQNLIAFLSFNKKPSKVIIQWPDTSRFYHIEHDLAMHLMNSSCREDSDHAELWKYFTINNIALDKNILHRIYGLTVLNNMQINDIYEIFSETGYRNNEQDIIRLMDCSGLPFNTNRILFDYHSGLDYARDLLHPGSKSNMIYAQRIIEVLK